MFRYSGHLLASGLLRAANKSPRIPPTVSASNYKRSARPFVVQTDQFQTALLAENRPLSADEWQTVRDELLASDGSINEVNIDASILGRCLPDGRLEVGKSYVRFLRRTGREPNLASMGRLLRLYHLGEMRGALTDEDRADILQICQDLQAKSTAYDANTSENMLHAIVATHAWRDGLALLNAIRLTAKPSASAFSLVAARAFGENDAQTGWQVMHDCLAADRIPKCEVFVAYWRMCAERRSTDGDERTEEELSKMLRFIGQHDLMVSQRVVSELGAVFETLGHRCKEVNIADNGNCPTCRRQLRSVFLTNKEFKQITTVFLERVLVRNDVFVKSSPAEVAKFEKFLQAHQPFDCVIDGLNVAFSTGNNKPFAYYGKLLAAVVRYFREQNKRVLVLGRKHMLKWPKSGMGYVQANAKVFLTDDLSQDDPFLLYATLKSGPATDFVSRDLMRGHAHLLGAELKPVFRRWQQEHQFHVDEGSHPGSVNISEPIKFQTNAHTVDGSWHVPFTDAYDAQPADTFALPSSWLCIAPPAEKC